MANDLPTETFTHPGDSVTDAWVHGSYSGQIADNRAAQTIHVTLNPNRTCEVVMRYVRDAEAPKTVQTGTWSLEGDDLVLQISETNGMQDGQAYRFKVEGRGEILNGNLRLMGAEGPEMVLHRD